MDGNVSFAASLNAGDPVMKIIVSALIALSVLSSLAAPASALDARRFWDNYDRFASNG
jgi:hypothetical protein